MIVAYHGAVKTLMDGGAMFSGAIGAYHGATMRTVSILPDVIFIILLIILLVFGGPGIKFSMKI